MAETLWPQSADFDTFHEYALSCSVWVREHPDAKLLRCSNCEAVLLYYPSMPPAQTPGHIYSDAGAREQRITGLCEWCFDKIAPPEDIAEGNVADDPTQPSFQAGEELKVFDAGSAFEREQDSLSKEDFDKLWDGAHDA